MDYFPMLPFIGLVSNLFLAIFILYLNPRDRLGRFYSYFAFSLALWSLGDYLTNTAASIELAHRLNHISTSGSSLMSVFLLLYILAFTKKEIVKRKIVYIIFLFPLFFLTTGIFTKLLTAGFETAPWGYASVPGPLYNYFSLITSLIVISGLVLCFKFYRATLIQNEKEQAKLIFFALLIPTIGGLGTQVIPPLLGYLSLPLTTTLTTITNIIVAYAIIKYRLMGINPETAVNNIIPIMTDYLILLNKEKKIVMANKALLAFLRVEEKAILGQSLDVISKDLDQAFPNFEQKTQIDWETSIMQDNIAIPVLVSATLAKVKNIPASYIFHIRDISHTKSLINNIKNSKQELQRANAELIRSRQELEQRVNQLEIFEKISMERENRLLELKIKLQELKASA